VYPLADYLVLTRADADALLRELPGVTAARLTVAGISPIQWGGVPVDSVAVQATLPSDATVLGRTFAAGRYFTADEAAANAAVVVLPRASWASPAAPPATPAARVGSRSRWSAPIGALSPTGSAELPPWPRAA
jgi:hypothetical protein